MLSSQAVRQPLQPRQECSHLLLAYLWTFPFVGLAAAVSLGVQPWRCIPSSDHHGYGVNPIPHQQRRYPAVGCTKHLQVRQIPRVSRLKDTSPIRNQPPVASEHIASLNCTRLQFRVCGSLVRVQGSGYPKPEQRGGRTETCTADDGHGHHLEELRHDRGHRSPGTRS